jgi:hypothetical protein
MTTTLPREPLGSILVVILLTTIATLLMLSVPPDSKVVDLVYGQF